MIHIRGLWLANGSGRSRKLAARARLAEERRKTMNRLIAELEIEQKNSPPWWVNI